MQPLLLLCHAPCMHRYCGRPVAASCFDMGDEDEDEEMTDAQAPAEQPAAQTGAGAQGCAPAAAVNAEVKPAEPDMSLVSMQSMAGCMAAGLHLHLLLHILP